MSAIDKPQINLYHAEDLENGVAFNYHKLLKIFLISFFIMLIWTAYEFFIIYSAKNDTQKAFDNQQEAYNQLVQYQQAFPNKQTSLNLATILEETQIEFDEKNEVLGALNFSESTSFDGFYLYLEGLANADINNLWLTYFSFSDAMDSMQINGVAKQASFVTKYLQSLQNTVFSGATFNDIAIEPYSNNVEAVTFVVSTKPNEIESINNLSENESIRNATWSSLEQSSQKVEQLSNRLIGGSQ